jgi:hypothetical protein
MSFTSVLTNEAVGLVNVLALKVTGFVLGLSAQSYASYFAGNYSQLVTGKTLIDISNLHKYKKPVENCNLRLELLNSP